MVLIIFTLTTKQKNEVVEEVDRAANAFRRLIFDVFYFEPYMKLDIEDPKIVIDVLIVAPTVQKYIFVLHDSGGVALTFLHNRKLWNIGTGAYPVSNLNTHTVI